MDLLELDGKALFDRHGIPIPRGASWPNRPEVAGALVVKAQVPIGKRGKQGGVLFAEDRDQAARHAERLRDATIAGHRVRSVYIEEQLAIERELYLSIMLDRDAGRAVFITSPDGGMDIESVPEERLLRLPIDPLLGLRSFHVRTLVRFLDVPRVIGESLAWLVEQLHGLFVAEDALLVEINPLVVTRSGKLVAADAKVVLDDNAHWRHPEWARLQSCDTRTDFEQAIARTGAVGIEVDPDGDVLAVISGAGLMMATLDLLATAGCRVRAVIDLGGSVLAGGEVLARVFRAVVATRPRTTFINAFMQTAHCDELARHLVAAHHAAPLPGRVLIRLKGRYAEEGRRLLAECGFEVHEDLRPAIAALAGRTDAEA